MKPDSAAQRSYATSALCVIFLAIVFLGGCSLWTGRNSNKVGWSFEYDKSGHITKITDTAGRTIRLEYAFDRANRLRRLVRTTADAVITTEYDEDERPIRMTDAAGTVSYGYDERGRLNRVQRQQSPPVIYAYDTLDRITSIHVGEFYETEYKYDFLGRLESIKTPAGTVQYEYLTGQGELIRTLPNGIRTIWEYDPGGQLKRLTHIDARNVVLAEYTYRYRSDRLIEAILERTSGGEILKTYEYDQMGRLIRATGRSGAQVYQYDEAGNRLKVVDEGKSSESYTYDWAGRLMALDGRATEHDSAGDITSVTINGTTLTYRHNQDSQLDDVDNGKVVYSYDGNRRLIVRKAGNVTTTFIPDSRASNWHPLVIDAAQHRTLMFWQDDTPLISIQGTNPEYFLEDHLGSVRLIANSDGRVTRQIDYDPFGVGEGSGDAEELAPRFAGMFWDPAAKIHLTAARAYSSHLGRFLQIDPSHQVPFAPLKNISFYAYADDDPVNFVDRNGAQAAPFDANKVWWDAFWQNLIFGGFAERDTINQIMQHALDRSNGSVSAANKLIEDWKTQPSLYQELYPGQTPTISALRDAADSMLARDMAGQLGGPIAATLTSAWASAHLIGEHSTLGPNDFSGGQISDSKWLPLSSNTVTSELNGIASGMGDTWKSARDLANLYTADFTSNLKTLLGGSHRDDLSSVLSSINNGRNSHDIAGDLSGADAMGLSHVGGVYLSGAGGSLSTLGLLNGVALDGNNNLVLLSQSGGEVKLPPLRLDDVVTVFRSVYLDGEGPTVTIDPNPKNPMGSTMLIKHSKATEHTYVGWILYQADRLMKTYTLGVDNITKQPVVTAVSGYSKLLDTMFFGGGRPDARRSSSQWERFWIVPAEVKRFSVPTNELTLFDVPLKVKTQSMKWRNGELVDDSQAKSSPGALAFTKWFAENYDDIGRERFIEPPSTTEIRGPVAIFTELRRIALITAIAEKLRDQGIPLPFWMRDYEVRRVDFEEDTPALEVPRSNQTMSARIYGGVGLSAAIKDIKDFRLGTDLSRLLPPEEAGSLGEKLVLSHLLEQAIHANSMSVEPFKVNTLAQQGKSYQTIALPGAETLALGSARLKEVDLSLEVEGSEPLQLVRHYNSFFAPNGPWGYAWTLDLPRLNAIRIPLSRDEKSVYQVAYELVTPLNSVYARFLRVESVPQLNGSRLQVPDRTNEFFGIADDRPAFLNVETHKLIRKDGAVWHFTKAGDLIAIDHAGSRVIYERDDKQRLTRMVVLRGMLAIGAIELRYDQAERVESAHSKGATTERTIRYEYDNSSHLVGVVSESGRKGYTYQGSLVTTVTLKPSTDGPRTTVEKVLRRFEYAARGQLLSETDTDGVKRDYHITYGRGGNTITGVSISKTNSATKFTRYDDVARPVEAMYLDGTRVSREYPSAGEIVTTITRPQGQRILLTSSADAQRQTLELDNRKLVALYDGSGRLTSIEDSGHPFFRQEWSSGGQLLSATNERATMSFDRDQQGLVSRIVLSPPESKGTIDRWQATILDPLGRPQEMTDFRGLNVHIQYARTGGVQATILRQGDKTFGFEISRDPSGRVEGVNSSWGTERYAYGPDGRLERLEVERAGHKSVTDWKSGLPQRVLNFDGGVTSFEHYTTGKLFGLLKIIKTPNQLELLYKYDDASRVSEVVVGALYRLRITYDMKGQLTGWNYSPVN